MFKTLRNAWKISELRSKILFTLLIIALYRIGTAIPVPFINYEALIASGTSTLFTTGVFGYLDILSGGALSSPAIFALSVTPYINAQIIMQLLTVAIPPLERLAKNGEEGRKKIEKITRYLTFVLAIITAIGYYAILSSLGLIVKSEVNWFFKAFVIVAVFTAGASVIMWLGERIDEQGIGNGISMILFANIVAALPNNIIQYVGSLSASKVVVWAKWVLGILTFVIMIASILFVTYMTDAERRIPVQYAKKVVGRKMYGGQSSNLPIKLNMAGVMPVIFASTMVSIVPTILGFVEQSKGAFKKGSFGYVVKSLFGTTSALYIILLFVLIIAFAYFYISISFNPVEVSNNLMQQGGFIPGIRPGKPTAQYITKVLNKIILMGALFLSIVACVPHILNAVSGGLLGLIAFSGTTLLIVVGVILETVRELEAQMTMRHYKGFLE